MTEKSKAKSDIHV